MGNILYIFKCIYVMLEFFLIRKHSRGLRPWSLAAQISILALPIVAPQTWAQCTGFSVSSSVNRGQ